MGRIEIDLSNPGHWLHSGTAVLQGLVKHRATLSTKVSTAFIQRYSRSTPAVFADRPLTPPTSAALGRKFHEAAIPIVSPKGSSFLHVRQTDSKTARSQSDRQSAG